MVKIHPIDNYYSNAPYCYQQIKVLGHVPGVMSLQMRWEEESNKYIWDKIIFSSHFENVDSVTVTRVTQLESLSRVIQCQCQVESSSHHASSRVFESPKVESSRVISSRVAPSKSAICPKLSLH